MALPYHGQRPVKRGFKIAGNLLGKLHLNVYTRGEFELRKRVHRFLVGGVDFNQALVCAQLKLLPGFLIYVRRPQYGIDIPFGGQRNRAGYDSPTVLYSFYDLLSRLVYQVVIVRPQFDANFLIHAR